MVSLVKIVNRPYATLWRKFVTLLTYNANYLFILDIDDCVNVTCNNLGTCIDGVNDYNCFCIAGYTGLHCETSKFLTMILYYPV